VRGDPHARFYGEGVIVISSPYPTTYERHLDAEKRRVGKENTQKIESKHINLRTRIKRLVRRTICFSKTEQMHDLVIRLFINRYEFGRAI
jgi:insertion element IS1 protein InsB